MDLLAHGLWTAVAARGGERLVRRRMKRKSSFRLRTRWAVFWGMFPDLFAFSGLSAWFVLQILRGVALGELPHPSDFEPAQADTLAIFRLTNALYQLSHSLLVFGTVFLLVLVLRQKASWEMLGWVFHISIDVFTHSYAKYPTPILWPLSSWKFDGIYWGTPWFLALNYSVLLATYAFLYRRKLRRAAIVLGKAWALRFRARPVRVRDLEER
ncbi:hypothetical protein D6833_10165 [Candidatus Parcubacteria bacterium]|nr:MAG: hypothetical protein D6833_10165 [Candidatus Parcubacteria bacterium]